MSSGGSAQPVVATLSNPASGEQTSQSLGYAGTAELHTNDKAVETGGRPVYEMSGSTPEHRGHVDELMSPVGDPPEYTASAGYPPIPEQQPPTTSESPTAPEQDVVSPLSESATYAPGGIISPLDEKIRY